MTFAIALTDSICYRIAVNLNTYLDTSETAARLAARIGCAPSLVSQWKNGVRPIPTERCTEIERATSGRVTCEELRPDLADHWAYLRGSKKAA